MASAPQSTALALSIVLFLAVLGVAIFTQISSTSLSLPISPVLTVLTLLLPLLAIPNAILLTTHRRRTSLVHSRSSSSLISHPILLQALQGILTIVLATLLATNFTPSPAIRCVLNDVWQRFYSTHDAEPIRRIQDALQCCGFQSTRDRAWPFGTPSTCPEAFDRQMSCREAWTAALRRNAGADFAVVVVVGLFQIVTLVLTRGDGSWSAGRWMSGFAQGQNGGSDVTRPLLAGDAHVDEVEDGDPEDDARRRGYDGVQEGRGPRSSPRLFMVPGMNGVRSRSVLNHSWTRQSNKRYKAVCIVKVIFSKVSSMLQNPTQDAISANK